MSDTALGARSRCDNTWKIPVGHRALGLGYLRVMFAVDGLDETLERLRKRGAQLVGEVVRYQDAYRLCDIRGPEGPLRRAWCHIARNIRTSRLRDGSLTA
jgi:hypothetical protein